MKLGKVVADRPAVGGRGGGYGIRRSPYGGAGLKLCYTAVVLRDYFVWAE
jgi:hypothetical protein